MVDVTTEKRSTNDSPRMAKLRKAARGVGVNTCPYGCTDEQAGEHGYCHHVVGSTVQGSSKVMEPMGYDSAGRRVTNAGKDGAGDPIKPGRQLVLATDHLELVTVSSLVYRKDAPKPKSPDDLLEYVDLEEEEEKQSAKDELALAGK